MGYPTEIFEVTDDIIAQLGEVRSSSSATGSRSTDVLQALEVAATPGAADKVMVTLD